MIFAILALAASFALALGGLALILRDNPRDDCGTAWGIALLLFSGPVFYLSVALGAASVI